MIRRKLKSMCGLTLAFVLAANMAPVVSYAFVNSNEENNGTESRIVNFDSPYLTEESSNKVEGRIVDGVDINSEESISVIIEFVSPSVAEGINTKGQARVLTESKIDRDHRMFNEFLESMPAKYKSAGDTSVQYSYKEVFNGVSLNIPGTEIETLLKCPVVKRVHPNTEVQVDLPEKLEVNEEGLTNLPEGRMSDSVPHIGVDDLHEENITGKGIKVGVLDTGIDYNHPDLTNTYNGFRAEQGDANSQDIDSTLGWDFISNDADPMETTYDEWLESGEPEISMNGIPYYTSHGTHVSGTIAGRAENTENGMAVKGVAPDVELYGYRVLGKYGSGAYDGIIAAVEKSVKDGMDVINLSLGSSSGTPFDPLVTAVNNASMAGVVTVIANGNAGPNPVTVGSPATAQLPIAVGATNTPLNVEKHELEISNGVKLSSAKHVVKDFDKTLDDVYGVSYEAVYCNLGYESDFEGKDLTGKVALVDRGDIMFVEKAQNAKMAGAEFVIIMNNTTSSGIPNQGEHKAGNAMAVNLTEGELIKSNLDENGVINITLNKIGNEVLKGDEITGFSSAGPVLITDEIRPDIVAPGDQIFSTVPEFINNKNPEEEDYSTAYGRMGGTSMASPHIAGVAALILQENPDYTPADVKAAMMNTSEDLNQFRDEEYSVHQQGSGRINAYEAVYEDTHITAKYLAIDGEDDRELENESGLISFGKFNKEENNPEDKNKIIPLTIENRSDVEKEYSISVKYSNSERAQNAELNGVTLEVESGVTVSPNSEVIIDTKINIPGNANKGIYEGYIVIVDNKSKEDYKIPFSASYKDNGFTDVFYPEIEEGFGKGLTAFTSSDLFNRDVTQASIHADVQVAIQLEEKVSQIYAFAKNIETGEYIGYAGGQMDASWIIPGSISYLRGLVPNGRVQKLKGNNITNEYMLLENGAYELEIIAVRKDGTTFKESLPMGIINDSTENNMTVNFEPGVIEVTEDMYTTETWTNGKDYEAVWIEGNITHPLVEELKKQHGMDYLEQSQINYPFFTYRRGSGTSTLLGNFVKENGDFLVAGIERSDLENGALVVDGRGINPGKVAGDTNSYIFINEGESYLELISDKETVKVGENLNTVLTLNNVEDITKGSFEISNIGNGIYDLVSIEPTKEFSEFLESNRNSVNINHTEVEGSLSIETKHLIEFEITGDNITGINGDMPLFNVTYNLSELRGLIEDVRPAEIFRDTIFECREGSFKNSKDEVVDVELDTVKDHVRFIEEDKTRILVDFYTIESDSNDVELYIVNENGTRYEADTVLVDGFGRKYKFENLPVIDGDYKVYANVPGHFGVIANVKGGEYVNGELVGVQMNLGTESFFAAPLMGIAGDVNEDGAIDMHDVNIILDLMNQEAINKPGFAPDLTQDGIVDLNDFINLYMNYGKQDFNREDSKEPELIVDGVDIIDVLDELGFFDYVEGLGITLDKDISESFEGQKVILTANTEHEPELYTFRFYTRLKGEKEWLLASHETPNNTFEWTPDKVGEYEIKVRAVHPSGQEIQDTVTHKVESLESIVTSPVSDFRATTVNKKNVTVEWNAPENTKGLTGYVLYKDGKKIGEIDANETSYTFKGLNRHTIYNFKIAAKYANGEISTKESITLRTKR